MLLLILLIVLIFGFPTFGSYYGGGTYRSGAFGLGGILLLVLIVLLFTHAVRF